MGRRKYHAPRRGSLGFVRKRAQRIYPRVLTWPKFDEPKLLGFPAYKVGMLSVIELYERKGSMFHGVKRSVAATALEAPPIKLLAVRVYQDTPYGLKTIDEIWTSKLEDPIRVKPGEDGREGGKPLLDYLRGRVTLPKDIKKAFGGDYLESKKEKIYDLINQGLIDEIKVLVATRPDLTGLGKKIPDIMEIKVGGNVKEAFDFALEKLGGYININEVFDVGQFVDIIGITKGKGFQGVVKRFGVKILPPKTKKEKRAVGSLGPWTPGRVMWTVPRYGQLGFFKRTEYNKQILAILVENFEKLNPKGGWHKYGIIRNPAIVLRGSVQGPSKRMVILRHAIRPRIAPFVPKVEEFFVSRERLEVSVQ